MEGKGLEGRTAGIEDRLVFAHQGGGDGGSDAAKGAGVGGNIDEMPGAGVCEGRLGVVLAIADCGGG